jgi:CDP-6-deoxy-D-xylo-4-hexulose-3-dehydrase
VTTPPSFRWPLAISPFTLSDKLAISAWIIAQDRYTLGAKTAELEARFSEFSGMHALMVANGSVANQLVFELWKVKNPGVVPVVIVPAVTWISSLSPILMAGMEIAFADVNLTDFALDYDCTARLVENYTAKGRRVIIWPTALIGWSPEMERLRRLARAFKADLYLDSCENTFSRLWLNDTEVSILASADMTTTSLYTSHQVTSCEGGFVFFRHRADYDLARMFRNHGLTRSLPADHPTRCRIETENPAVDPQFLFALAGTNMRPTDVHAMFGLRDFARIPESLAHRNRIYRLYHDLLDHGAYYLPPLTDTHAAFCLPIIARRNDELLGDGATLKRIKRALTETGIENRPLIGSCLPGLQPAFRDYGPPERYPTALWLHHRACYCGLHSGVTAEMVAELCDLLNGLALQNAA